MRMHGPPGGGAGRPLPPSLLELEQREIPLDFLGLLRRLFTYARPYAAKRNALVVLVILRSALLPTLAWAIGAIISGPISHGDIHGILLATAGFAALAVFVQVAFHFRMRLALEFGEAVIHDLRAEVFRHLLRLKMAFYDKTKAGQIIGRMTSDLDAIRLGVQDIVFVSIVQVGQMIVSSLFMIWYDWVLFLIVLAIAPIVWKLNQEFKRQMVEKQRKAQASFSRITAAVAESVSGVRVTQGFVREETNAGFFRNLVADHSRYNLDAAHAAAIFLPLLELSSQFFVAVLLVVGGYRALNPHIALPVGDIVQFFFLANMFFEPIKSLGNQYIAALTALVGAERIFQLLDRKPEWSDSPEATPIPRISGDVEFIDLSFGYEPEQLVLKNITFRVEAGQTVALVGHTGSGKSSIINLVTKMYLPTRGRIEIDGCPLAHVTSDSLHHQMGIVHQDSFLFEGTVMDNIRFARPEATAKEVIEIARRLDCLDLLEQLPNGLHTEVGERGARLSAGQRQIISFARALMVNPRILVLDEATSAIDTLTEARLQKALEILLEGRTTFVVAHRLSTIRRAGLILVLDHGEIVERGTHEQLVERGGVYAGLHRHFKGAA